MKLDPILVFYTVPMATIVAGYVLHRRRIEAKAIAAREEAQKSGLSEPASLHPVFDASLCIGCKACIKACPEGDVIGLIGGKAALVSPAECIGHGACRAACPRGAITLVFGTETRGVEIPHVNPDFSTNVSGIYIAGELGGMGLIRNAIEQGRQAIAAIADARRPRPAGYLDVVIVGGGPAGLSASLGAKERGLSFVTLEQDTMGGTVAHFPRGKLVMTAPATLPLVGKVRFKEVRKERLISFWQKVVSENGLKLNTCERVEAVEAIDGGFLVRTARGQYRTSAVLLAVGRRGTPRRLGVPGEDVPQVVYRLTDPEQYRGKHVLVVGGGDSALEAAASLAEEPGTTVTLSYRGAAFGRAKTKNRHRVDAAAHSGRLDVRLNSQVLSIESGHVMIDQEGHAAGLRNDVVIVCAGGILPSDFLKSIGIRLETKHGTA